MSQALGQDLKSSSIQLGKALNDPTQGMTALRRVGVSFSEDQQKVIKSMQATGNLAGAQKLILEELNKEFGGSAAAAVKADGGITQLKNKMNDLQETIGAKLIPVQLKFKQIQFEIIDFLVSKGLPAFDDLANKYGPQIAAAFDSIQAAAQPFIDQIVPFFETLSQNEEVMNKVAVVVGGVLVAAFGALAVSAGAAAVGVLASMAPFLAIGAVVAALALGVRELVIHWDEITAKFPIIGQAVTFVKQQFADLQVYWDAQLLPALTRIKDRFVEVVTAIVGFVQANWPQIKAIISPILAEVENRVRTTVAVITGAFKIIVDLINGDWTKAWTDLKATVATVWAAIKASIANGLELIKQLAPVALAAGDLLMNAIWDGLLAVWDQIMIWVPKIPGAIVAGLGKVGELLVEAGKAIMQGLWDGLQAKWREVKDWVGGLGDKIKGLKGPIEVDRVLLHPEGLAIMQGLQAGLEDGSAGVFATVGSIAAAVKSAAAAAVGAMPASPYAGGFLGMQGSSGGDDGGGGAGGGDDGGGGGGGGAKTGVFGQFYGRARVGPDPRPIHVHVEINQREIGRAIVDLQGSGGLRGVFS
jgi:phage-related protein